MKDINVAEVFRNPVRRSELVDVLDCKSDREARKCIEQLREKGYNIVNGCDGRGYYLASDEETLKYAAMRRKRALAEFRAANLMMLRASKKEGIKIPVRAHFRTVGKRDDENTNQICLEV
jgi:biotin operon repressor